MVWPDGIRTRTVSAGKPYILESGEPALVEMSAVASRPLTYNGLPLLSRAVATGRAGEVFLELPVTDLEGMCDDKGNPIDLSDGGHTHTYTVECQYRDLNGQVIPPSRRKGPFVIPSDSPDEIDFDLVVTDAAQVGLPIPLGALWQAVVAAAADGIGFIEGPQGPRGNGFHIVNGPPEEPIDGARAGDLAFDISSLPRRLGIIRLEMNG